MPLKQTKIFVIGDTHGAIPSIIEEQKQAHIIHVGDFWFGSNQRGEAEYLRKLDELLRQNNSILYANLGNWDDPSFWTEDKGFTNIKFPKTYEVVNLCGFNYAFLGGAVSIDRKDRIEPFKVFNNSFENSPKANEEIFNKLLESRQIDCFISHTAPSTFYPDDAKGFAPIVHAYAKNDKELFADLTKERSQISLIFNKIHTHKRFYRWFYGHFHPKKGLVEKHDNVEAACLPILGWIKVFEL